MKLAKTSLLIIGGLAVLLGLIWAGQGAGIITYPASSFMINQTPWIWRGLGLAIAGVIGVAISRRM